MHNIITYTTFNCIYMVYTYIYIVKCIGLIYIYIYNLTNYYLILQKLAQLYM